MTPVRCCQALAFAAIGVIFLATYFAESPEALILDPPADLMDPSLFQRDQPTLRRAFQWDGAIVVQGDESFYSIDLVKATAAPVRIPGTRQIQILLIASRGSGQAIALCRDRDGLCLLYHDRAEWKRLQLPETIRSLTEPPLLCADESSVVLLAKDRLFRFTDDRWISSMLNPRPVTEGIRGGPRRVLLTGKTLYLGFDRGEWGGGLLSLDVNTGDWDAPSRGLSELPVRDLAVTPDGTVWVVEGLAHLGLRDGRLSCFEGGKWKVVCACSGRKKAKRVDWNLPPCSFDAISFDRNGQLYLLSGELGLIRRDGAKWTRLTPGWPEYVYVSSLCLSSTGVAVIATSDAGVLLFDLNSGRVQRVVLKTS
jgi:hypothetical protein